MQTDLIAIIPAYEPDEIMIGLLKEADSSGFRIVVVNDGSSRSRDGIFSRASHYGTVLKHSENRGKGRAIKTGLKYIEENYPSDSIVVTLDADGQHRLEDAERICREVQKNPQALVLGSRGLDENVPMRSKIGNSITRIVYRAVSGVAVHDTQTGLRAFSAALIPQLIGIPGERYEYEMNVLLQCPRAGIPIEEIGISTIYIDGNSSSHFNTIKDSCLIYKEILKFSASSFTGFLMDYGLYALLTLLTAGFGTAQSIVISNIGARIVSAGVNYTMNSKIVFRSDAGFARSAGRYALLACAILAGNTLVLSLLADYAGMNRFAAKIVTEMLFFAVSYIVQRRFVFSGRSRADKKESSASGNTAGQPAAPNRNRSKMLAVHRKGVAE